MKVLGGNLADTLVRLSAVIAIAASLGACSVMPDWLGGDSGSDSTVVSDDSATAPPAGTQTADNSNGQFPDLADTPNRPAAPSTSDEQKQVADSLSADRNSQNYSADALKAGTETAAPPPGAAPPPDAVQEVDTGSKSSSDDSSRNSSSSADTTTAAAPAPSSAAPAPAATTAVATAPAPAASGGMPAVPAVPPSSVNGAQSVGMTDASLGFQPSKAPPLDASVGQFVPGSIMSRYQQTASLGGAAGVGGSTYAGGGAAVPSTPQRAMGGPEQMSGAVVANFESLQGASVGPAAYSNAIGLPPAAVVRFGSDTTILDADAKSLVKSAADSFNARGGTGYIRVVGHASTASTRLSEDRRLQINFERSQARATAVMRELVKDGVPASKVLMDAVGDTQPVYDSGAQGENGNRRADIFFQG